MEEFIALFSSFSAIVVPLAILATVQYCGHFGIEMDSKKLLIFAWSLGLLCFPFSLFFLVFSFSSLHSGEANSNYLAVALAYLGIGWMICSAIYGKPIVPRFSKKEINLP